MDDATVLRMAQQILLGGTPKVQGLHCANGASEAGEDLGREGRHGRKENTLNLLHQLSANSRVSERNGNRRHLLDGEEAETSPETSVVAGGAEDFITIPKASSSSNKQQPQAANPPNEISLHHSRQKHTFKGSTFEMESQKPHISFTAAASMGVAGNGRRISVPVSSSAIADNVNEVNRRQGVHGRDGTNLVKTSNLWTRHAADASDGFEDNKVQQPNLARPSAAAAALPTVSAAPAAPAAPAALAWSSLTSRNSKLTVTAKPIFAQAQGLQGQRLLRIIGDDCFLQTTSHGLQWVGKANVCKNDPLSRSSTEHAIKESRGKTGTTESPHREEIRKEEIGERPEPDTFGIGYACCLYLTDLSSGDPSRRCRRQLRRTQSNSRCKKQTNSTCKKEFIN